MKKDVAVLSCIGGLTVLVIWSIFAHSSGMHALSHLMVVVAQILVAIIVASIVTCHHKKGSL